MATINVSTDQANAFASAYKTSQGQNNPVVKPGGYDLLSSTPPLTISPNSPGIVPQVYPGSTGSGSNQNVSTNSYGGYSPVPTTLNANQSPIVTASSTPTTISAKSATSTPSISSSSLTSSPSISLPSAPTYSNPGSINNAGLASLLASSGYTYNPDTNTFALAPKQEQSPADKAAAERKNNLDYLLGVTPQKDSLLGSPEVKAQQDVVNQKQQELNNYTSQLNAIVAKQTQDLLSLRQVGSQEGVTETVYGGQQATINREAAIKALPVQAQISAAQGNLKLAQDYLGQIKDLKQEQIDSDYSYNIAKFNAIKDYVTGEDKIKLDKITTDETRAYNQSRDNINTQDEWSKIALDSGQSDLISQIQKVNPASPTFATDLAKVTSGIHQDELKQLQIAKAKTDLANAQGTNTGTGLVVDYSGFLQSRTPQQIIAFNALPTSDKGVVAQLVNGDALLTDIVKSRGASGTKDIQKYIDEATSIDPTFSVNNNKVRYTFMQGWNNPNGKSSTTRNALNTALGHLADFKTNADALDSGAIKRLNSVSNILTTETGDPKVLRLRTDINALATEVATAYKGGQPTEAEIKNWEQTIAADFSKAQFKGVTDELTKLLSSKITASRYQFKSTMGYEYGQSIIDPDKKQLLINAGVSPDVFPQENTGNPNDNPFGQTISKASSNIFDTSTGLFNIPTE